MKNTTLNFNSPLLSGGDASIRPQDDLFGAVNGQWLETFEIPSDRPMHGAFYDLFDQSEENVNQIIKECAEGKIEDADAEKISLIYNSFLDEKTIEERGISDLLPLYEAVNQTESHEEFGYLLGVETRHGSGNLFGFYVENNSNDPGTYHPYFHQGGLSLPDESFYHDETQAGTREAYLEYLTKFLPLAGVVSEAEAEKAAKTILEFETSIADLHWDRVRARDISQTNNQMTWDELVASASDFPWEQWVKGLDLPAEQLAKLVVRQPDFFSGLAKLYAKTELSTLQLWLRWKIAKSNSRLLTSELVLADFDFWSKQLTGAQELRARWKRGVSLVQDMIGQGLGRLYVARHFPPANKAKMEVLVENLTEAYRQSIQTLDWMGAETREEALDKLAKFNPKIGYPNSWRDYSSLKLADKSLVEMARESARFETDFELRRIGDPINPDEWHMDPQEVNAYYNPVNNEIVFPAAILQPPFFDPEAADAINYAGIGAVIGHEIGHGFDDQGSKYDGKGALRDWWTAEDRAEFEKRTKKLIDQYNQFSPRNLSDEYKVNGEFTIGENIGDLGGLAIAWKAWLLSLKDRGIEKWEDAPEVDGIAAAQAFFVSWGLIWRTKAREEIAKHLLTIDPHSPGEFRCNGIVSNLDSFYEVFGVTKDDKLWLDPEDRVTIW
ncbi:hypothetical protein BK816_03085 [Boudabousia tangfeifanii]|uniref:Peptidase M13 n=1 Tax=Boudabousia tangfeifanii TaxID=1912795 RepID=A0A1D9MJP1_9ACTO|nr:M13-type metalloendopeptidase [Boudabousia tangfeifanii]AOZ72403.1 hypothetical protein BK816_03085 [Boudabousia tangfeifanii]